MNISRRDFIKKGGLSLLILGLSGPLGLWSLDKTARPARAAATDNVLVLVQLSGGNDGLNTVVPYTQGIYFDNRPTLGLKQTQVLPINNELGFHPSLVNLKKIYDQGKMAIVNGVGYPQPSLSHFRSMDIWQTAAPERLDVTTGWLGRYLDLTQDPTLNPLAGITVGFPSRVLMAEKSDAPAVVDVNQFQMMLGRASLIDRQRRITAFEKIYAPNNDPTLALVRSKGIRAMQASERLQSVAEKTLDNPLYPVTRFADELHLVADIIGAGLGTRTFFTQLGGFDDHAKELNEHANMLKQFDQAVGAFYTDLEQRGLADRVTVLIYSEFGRRVKENASAGTDHGTAAPVFVLGGKVAGGLYGELPSLSVLEDGDLKYSVDFRSVYATLLDRWLGAPSKDILNGSFEILPFV